MIDGETGAQRFFLNWARAWRTQTRPAEVQRRLAIDPHSPPEFRCNQVVRNLDEFYEAFGVSRGRRDVAGPGRAGAHLVDPRASWVEPVDR